MDAKFTVWLDEDRQIIRQRITGEPTLSDFLRLAEQTRDCVLRLRCPDDVRILVDGSWFGRMRKDVRAASSAELRRPELTRMAIVTTNRVARVLIRFMVVATGQHKVRTFSTESAALDWLVS
jgi:hypothetical protein